MQLVERDTRKTHRVERRPRDNLSNGGRHLPRRKMKGAQGASLGVWAEPHTQAELQKSAFADAGVWCGVLKVLQMDDSKN